MVLVVSDKYRVFDVSFTFAKSSNSGKLAVSVTNKSEGKNLDETLFRNRWDNGGLTCSRRCI